LASAFIPDSCYSFLDRDGTAVAERDRNEKPRLQVDRLPRNRCRDLRDALLWDESFHARARFRLRTLAWNI